MSSIERKAVEAIKAIKGLSECSICLTAYTDPRILPCLHTSCLKCLEDMQRKNNKKPGDVLPCPICRKEFTIPSEGIGGLQKNFFIENLMEITKTINTPIERPSLCNTCSMISENSKASEATMRCLNCQEDFCLRCSKIHTSQRLARGHKLIELFSALSDDKIQSMFSTRNCVKHSDKVLDFYCSDCKTVVCASCSAENHKLHECRDVNTIDKEFRRRLEDNYTNMSAYSSKLVSKKEDIEREKHKFYTQLKEREDAIRRKSEQMRSLIDQHTQHLLDDLSLIKQKNKKIIELELEEVERQMTVLETFVVFCNELSSKGSVTDVCGSAENLIARSEELKEGFDEYLNAPSKSFEIEFTATDEKELLENVNNLIGTLSGCECFAIVTGLRQSGNDESLSNKVIKINLDRPEEVSYLEPVPAKVQKAAATAVYSDSMFVSGIGLKMNEIWKFNGTSWKQCASMTRGRRRHSVAFVNHVMYICGGYVDSEKRVIKDVEAYDSTNDKCATVGQLSRAVDSSGNCVPYKTSLYIFGGCDNKNKIVTKVQVYDTQLNICSMLQEDMPSNDILLRAVLCKDSAILLGCNSCFIYNFETKRWQWRDRFMTDVFHFGSIVHNGKIFVLGGGRRTSDANGKITWILRDDIRYVPVKSILANESIDWKHHSWLPRPSTLHVCEKMKFSLFP